MTVPRPCPIERAPLDGYAKAVYHLLPVESCKTELEVCQRIKEGHRFGRTTQTTGCFHRSPHKCPGPEKDCQAPDRIGYRRVNVKLVQLAIQDSAYASSLSARLAEDGNHRVHLVGQPNALLDGVVVIDEATFVKLSLLEVASERIVLILPRRTDLVSRAWSAGIQNVAFVEDSINIVQLAILAAEIRLHRSRVNHRWIGS